MYNVSKKYDFFIATSQKLLILVDMFRLYLSDPVNTFKHEKL